jgi:hypothetical protein
VELFDGFKFAYELFVHPSKVELNRLVERNQFKEEGGRMTKSSFTPVKGGYATDTLSQSDAE